MILCASMLLFNNRTYYSPVSLICAVILCAGFLDSSTILFQLKIYHQLNGDKLFNPIVVRVRTSQWDETSVEWYTSFTEFHRVSPSFTELEAVVKNGPIKPT